MPLLWNIGVPLNRLWRRCQRSIADLLVQPHRVFPRFDVQLFGQETATGLELSQGGGATVRLEALPSDHPFGNMNLTDNVVRYVSRRYSDNPLVVQGPGAGPSVTAAGVFADLLRLASYLGAPR